MLDFEKFDVRVPRELFEDSNVSGFDIACWAYIQADLMTCVRDNCYIHPHKVAFDVLGKVPSKDYVNQAKGALEKIMDLSFINGQRENGWFYIKRDELCKMVQSFTMFKLIDIEKIIQSKYRYKFELVKLFTFIMGSRYYENGAATMSHMYNSWFASKMSCHENTISRYVNTLEELNVIYVRRDPYYSSANAYGSIRDKDAIDAYAQSHRYMSGSESVTANQGRRLCQIYNQIVKGRDYPLEVRKEVLKYMKQRNDTYRSLAAKEPKAGHEKKIVDIDIINV